MILCRVGWGLCKAHVNAAWNSYFHGVLPANSSLNPVFFSFLGCNKNQKNKNKKREGEEKNQKNPRVIERERDEKRIRKMYEEERERRVK